MTTKKVKQFIAGVSLKSLAENKEDTSITKSLPTFTIDPRRVIVDKSKNGRPIDPAHVAAMRLAWDNDVLLPPVGIHMVDGETHLLYGYHRMEMYMQAIAEGVPIERVPAIEIKGDAKVLLFAMMAENSGKGWAMPELGVMYAEAVNKFGMTFAEVGAKRGMSAQHVKDCIRLTEQSADIKGAVKSGEIAPATALKLIKNAGQADASRIIAEARVLAPKGKITQKVIDNLGKAVVEKAGTNAVATLAHLEAMIESPTVAKNVKTAARLVVGALTGKVLEVPAERTPEQHIKAWLVRMSQDTNEIVSASAKMLEKKMANEFIPANASPESKYYGHMMWLQDLAEKAPQPGKRTAARWFYSALEAMRSDREVALPPQVLSIEQAMLAELESKGAVLAVDLCPEHANLMARWHNG